MRSMINILFCRARFSALLAVACVCLAACSLAPEPDTPELVLPPSGWQLSGAGTVRQDGAWWQIYDDAGLTGLVNEVLAYNSDIQLAQARVAEARAVSGYAAAQRLPSVSAAAAHTRSDPGTGLFPVSVGAGDVNAVGGLLSFEVDLWGRLANMHRAARERFLAEGANARTVSIAITAETAADYFTVAALNQQIGVTRKLLSNRQEALRLEKLRLDHGVSDALAYQQSDAQLSAIKARLPLLEQQREHVLSGLAVLMGKSPAEIMAGRVFAGADQSVLPALPPLPARDASEVVVARPDIIAGEHRLAAAGANIGVARAAYLPRLSVSALLGALSGNLDTLLNSDSRLWGTQVNATVPLLDFGRIRAQIDAAQAQEKQAYIAYGKTVRVAFGEIRDALVARDRLSQALTGQERQLAAANETVRLMRRRLGAGDVGASDVLEAERGQLEAEAATVDLHRQLLQSSVALYKALGAGV